ncbi:uncharacterized protein LOC113652114 isoform X1 [Tachysurus ichikawai]
MRFSHFSQLFVCFSHPMGILMCLNPNRSWKCLNDYLYTIRCELNMPSDTQPHDALYWLEFYDEREPFECVLMSHTSPWVCVMNLSKRVEETFMDTDFFQISLNYSFHGKNDSVVLETGYKPVRYIQPVPPSHLMLLWKPDEAVFHWLSGYDDDIMLVPQLQYQLSIQGNGKVLDIHSSLNNLSVPMSTFAPNANYTAHVRSEPHQIHYKGVWSHWGSTVYWTTGSTSTDDPVTSLAPVWMALFALPIVLLFYISYTRCKGCLLTSSPAPHIGDIKCSVMLPENLGDLLQREESLQIDRLIEEPNPTWFEANDGSSQTSFASSPTSPSMGSWAQAWMSVEQGSTVMYSDEYCTLSHTPSEHGGNANVTHAH